MDSFFWAFLILSLSSPLLEGAPEISETFLGNSVINKSKQNHNKSSRARFRLINLATQNILQAGMSQISDTKCHICKAVASNISKVMVSEYYIHQGLVGGNCWIRYHHLKVFGKDGLHHSSRYRVITVAGLLKDSFGQYLLFFLFVILYKGCVEGSKVQHSSNFFQVFLYFIVILPTVRWKCQSEKCHFHLVVLWFRQSVACIQG